MAGVESAEHATEIAVTFVKKHTLIARPLSARREDGAWVVRIDVGALRVNVATVTIESDTGTIAEYDIPPAGPPSPPLPPAGPLR